MAIPWLSRARRSLRGLLRRSGRLDGAPISKISLLVIVLIDLFILVNILTGLDAIAAWPLTPPQSHPCQQAWSDYRRQRAPQRDLEAIEAALPAPGEGRTAAGLRQRWLESARGRLGGVEATCLTYAELSDRISEDARLQALGAGLRQRRQEIAQIETASEAIRRQYDSSLLEQIAGQPRSRSLNPVAAAEARRRLEADQGRIVALRQQTEGLAGELLGQPASRRFLAFLNEPRAFSALERSYERAVFWFPSLQLLLQSLFLLPLLLGSLAVHRQAARRGHDLVALISWHLLVITLIPLLLKLLAFTQVGALFTLLAGWIRTRLGDLLFLISYLYILLIPLLGYGLIQLLQKVVLHPRLQAMARVQRGRCLRCARRLPPDSAHCPYCGTGQLQPCPACDRPTQRGLPHCRHCGHSLISTSVSAFPLPARPLA